MVIYLVNFNENRSFLSTSFNQENCPLLSPFKSRKPAQAGLKCNFLHNVKAKTWGQKEGDKDQTF